MSLKQIFKPAQMLLVVPYLRISQFSPVVKANPYITLIPSPHKNRKATPTATRRPSPDLAASAAAPAAFAEAVGLLVVDDAELVPEVVTVDIVVEAAVIELVTLPLELDVEPVELDAAAAAFVLVPETEAADEGADEATDDEAIVVESIANWPE
jgi:hypothetical protein